MSLKDKIQNQLVADTDSILEEHLNAVSQLFKLHKDGSVDLSQEVIQLPTKIQILAYLIAKRYAAEGGLADSGEIETPFFYSRFSTKQSTVRGYQKELRDQGLIRKTGKSTHELTVENLPLAVEQIEKQLTDTK